MIGYNGVVVFDHYLDQSLKKKEKDSEEEAGNIYWIWHSSWNETENISQGVAILIKKKTWFSRIWSYVTDMQIYYLARYPTDDWHLANMFS